MGDTTTAVSDFEAVRARLFGIAYRMLGSRAEADVYAVVNPEKLSDGGDNDEPTD